MSSDALIQIVSEQTLPNILPALALKPARVVLCHTSRTEPHARWIASSLALAGLSSEVTLRPLGEQPDLHETGATVRETVKICRAAGLEPVVNFTGGTKLMGIGAFVAALNEKSASIYTDTENRRFVDGGTALLPLPLADNHGALERAEHSLTLDVVAAAHGIESISPGEDPGPWMPLALHLWNNPGDEAATHAAMGGLNPRNPVEAARLLATPLRGLPPAIRRLGAEAGILRKRRNKWYFHRPATLAQLEAWCGGERYTPDEWFAAVAPLQQALNILMGSWWELAVFDTAQRSRKFRDLRWSVQVTTGGQSYEKDIMALDGLNLVIMSCKRAGERIRLVAAIDELDSNARQVGGSHAHRYLCVASAKSLEGRQGRAAENRARQTRVKLIGPAAQLRPESFHR